MLNKRDELQLLIDTNEPEIIGITEVIPKGLKKIVKTEFEINGYELFINENCKRGAALYIKKERNPLKYVNLCEKPFEESVWAHFECPNGNKVLIGCIYKSPSSSDVNNTELINLLHSAEFEKFDHVCIVGDFNFPDIDWVYFSQIGEGERKFIDAIQDAFMYQMVKKPTRNKEGQKASVLDLVIVNNGCLVSDIEHCSPIGKSNHDVLSF